MTEKWTGGQSLWEDLGQCACPLLRHWHGTEFLIPVRCLQISPSSRCLHFPQGDSIPTFAHISPDASRHFHYFSIRKGKTPNRTTSIYFTLGLRVQMSTLGSATWLMCSQLGAGWASVVGAPAPLSRLPDRHAVHWVMPSPPLVAFGETSLVGSRAFNLCFHEFLLMLLVTGRGSSVMQFLSASSTGNPGCVLMNCSSVFCHCLSGNLQKPTTWSNLWSKPGKCLWTWIRALKWG